MQSGIRLISGTIKDTGWAPLCFNNCQMLFYNCPMLFNNCPILFNNCPILFNNCPILFTCQLFSDNSGLLGPRPSPRGAHDVQHNHPAQLERQVWLQVLLSNWWCELFCQFCEWWWQEGDWEWLFVTNRKVGIHNTGCFFLTGPPLKWLSMKKS